MTENDKNNITQEKLSDSTLGEGKVFGEKPIVRVLQNPQTKEKLETVKVKYLKDDGNFRMGETKDVDKSLADVLISSGVVETVRQTV
jgi:hypothetical protein